MDKSSIERFAINARVKLRQSVIERLASLGISQNGNIAPVQVIGDAMVISLSNGMETRIAKEGATAREQLIQEINRSRFDNVVESVAYTWFNRLIAIRYMEVNDFLPTHIRVLSSVTPGKAEPDLVTQCLTSGIDIQNSKLEQIKGYRDKGESDKVFIQMFLLQCRALNKILPELFTITKPYEDLLLKISFTDRDGVVRDLVDTIPEDDFKDAVQIIGWMYQYYNTELKADTFAKLKKNTKISKERIPSATQLFTPDWIVRYMVENSVGRIWLEGHVDPDLKSKWRYYLDEAEQESEVKEKLKEIRADRKNLSPASIKVIDPCMGSGHILVYVFDVLMQIYQSYGYTKNESAVSIVENNLYGLDIDDRAYQLAYFAVMMKARQYDPDIFNKNVRNNIHAVVETSGICDDDLRGYGNTMLPLDRNIAIRDTRYIISSFRDGKTLGSLIDIRDCDWSLVQRFLSDRRIDISVDPQNHARLLEAVEVAKVLSQKYDVVVTNPPYMGSSGMSAELSGYVKKYYPDSKSDLFAVFIEKCGEMLKTNGFNCMVTMQSWMFLSSFEKMREKILKQKTITNLMHMENMVMGIAFGTAVVNIRNVYIKDFKGTYNHVKMCDIDNKTNLPISFPIEGNRFAQVSTENFAKIPGMPVAYWISEAFIDNFGKGISINSISDYTGSQNITADNEKYLRHFWEVSHDDVGLGKKWVMYAKGGDSRKYYGNLINIVDWSTSSRLFYKNNKTSNLLDSKYWYKEGITYTMLSSKGASFRYLSNGCVFDKGGPSIVSLKENLYYVLGLLNSNVSKDYLNMLNPTINLQVKDVNNIPVIIDNERFEEVSKLVKECVMISKMDWDSNEYSVDYSEDCLVRSNKGSIKSAVEFNNILIVERREKMHFNEQTINAIFNEIYKLDEPIDCSIDCDDIDIKRDVKRLLSYSIGCIFGRYSLDECGLICAGREFDSARYLKFKADEDNIVPINDDEYFGDDIVTRFVEFIKVAFGSDNIDENLKFIVDNLGIKGSETSREKIRKYFLNDFYKDHLKMYQKRPIYWLFDSGKENGFKALIYMHRYDENLIGKMRQNYLLPMQSRYRDQMERETDQVKRSSLQKKIAEIERYDLAMELYSSNKVSIDLDDGVKVNYAKFQNIENSRSAKDKIDLLYRI